MPHRLKHIRVHQPTLLLTSSAAFCRRIVGGLWPFGLVLPWYLYTVKLGNMKFGGADPAFVKEFTWCNYIIKYYTIGICGLCGQPVKVWVDKCIVMGEPKFDKDMANQDSQADSANPNELSQRFTNQSTSGAQTMSVQVPQGLQGGMPMQVQTPGGVMQVQIPAGLQPGTAFKIQVPTSVALTAVSQANDLERGGAVPVVAVVAGACTVPSTGPPAQQPQAQPAMQKMSVQVPQGLQGGMPMQVQTAGGVMQVLIPAGLQPGTAFEFQVPKSNDPSLPIATSKVDTKAEEKAAAAAAQACAQARGQEEATLAAAIAASLAMAAASVASRGHRRKLHSPPPSPRAWRRRPRPRPRRARCAQQLISLLVATHPYRAATHP